MYIFDMDGTLLDSNGIWKDIDTAFLAKRGIPYTRAYYNGVAHTVFSKAAAFTKEFCHLSESTEEIMAEWMTMAGNIYAEQVEIKPGVRAFLDQCRARGERCIVLTSSVPAHCRAGLHRHALEPYFENLLFAQELGLEKKEPEIFRIAARTMGVSPEECTVFDDSVAACRGAKGAGMTAIGVHDDYFSVEEPEMKTVCDRYIDSFAELMGDGIE
jgi:HAD superfamily hydrolase (TIGR01509 family)